MTEPLAAAKSVSWRRGNGLLLVLTIATSLVAAVMVSAGRASLLEAVSFVTGAVCVWLVVRENVWNYPIGLVNVTTFSIVFFRAGLYGDAGLQVVYFVLACVGWYLWLHGGEKRTALRISRASTRELAIVGALVAAGTFALWKLLYAAGGSVAFIDATTTAMSLGAQWLINRKKLESWIGWIVVDIIYVPLYIYKELYLTAILYAVFLVMAVMGWRQWRATYRAMTLGGGA